LIAVLRFNSPIGVAPEFAVLAEEHLGSFFPAFELPIEPGERDAGEFTAVGAGVGAGVADVQVGHDDRDMVDAGEVVHGVFVSDVRRAAHDVEDGSVEALQGLLVRRGIAAMGEGSGSTPLLQTTVVEILGSPEISMAWRPPQDIPVAATLEASILSW